MRCSQKRRRKSPQGVVDRMEEEQSIRVPSASWCTSGQMRNHARENLTGNKGSDLAVYFLNDKEQVEFESGPPTDTEDEQMPGPSGSTPLMVEDREKPDRSDEVRQTEEEPPEKRSRMEEFEDRELSEVWVMEVKKQVYTGLSEAAERMHASEGIELMDVERRVSDSGKQGHTTIQAAKLAEIQGLMDMDVMEEWTLEAVREKGWKVISCKYVTTERDHIGSGLYKARYVARGFEEKVDDTGWKNCAATAGMHSCKLLLARAMASQLGTGANRWAVKIADVSQAFLYADVAEGMNTFVEAPDENYKLKNLNKENGVKV